MATLLLGNTAVLEPVKQDESSSEISLIDREDLGQQITTVTTVDQPLGATLADVSALWNLHSSQPPAWVFSPDDEELGKIVALHFGVQYGQESGYGEEED